MLRTRGFALALLVVAAAWSAGCAKEEGPPLAQPTDVIHVPSYKPPPTPTVVWDFDDPGLVFDGQWRPGDEWDYESNTSALRQVRVSASFTYQGLPHYLVTERTDRPQQVPVVRRYIVQAEDWLQRNTTDAQGITLEYDPGIPMRQARNATYFYNMSIKTRSSEPVPLAAVAATTRYPTNVTLQFPWGFVEAAKIEHRITFQAKKDGEIQRRLITRYLSAEFLNDIMIVESDETWKLIAAKVGDMQRGKLLGT